MKNQRQGLNKYSADIAAQMVKDGKSAADISKHFNVNQDWVEENYDFPKPKTEDKPKAAPKKAPAARKKTKRAASPTGDK